MKRLLNTAVIDGEVRGAMVRNWEGSVYRTSLWRIWDPRGPLALFIGLNPSLADGEKDDPTIRRMRGFAKRMACGGLLVGNLFCLVEKDPSMMVKHGYPTGPGVYAVALDLAKDADIIVACWGSYAQRRVMAQASTMLFRLRQFPVFCLGRNADGSPHHPLYLRHDTPLEVYREAMGQPKLEV